jgi:hypothetical protein
VASRAGQWRQESAAYNRAFSLLKQSWTGEAVENPGDLRLQVRQYEDLIRTVTDAGGYGNLVLADSARRLSLGMIGRYAATHPSEYATIGDLLADVRIRLLDCPATSDMIADELGLAPPSGSWRLSEKQEELRLVFRSDGSSFREAGGRSLLGALAPSTMIGKRDVSGLLSRLMEDEMMARAILPALVEFLKRGGSLANLESFGTVMEDQGTRFAFPPLGEQRIYSDNIRELVNGFRKWNGRTVPFGALVGE